MSMRLRLAIMCLVVGLLPAIPLSLLVHALLEKSFNVGLSGTVSDALESGVSVSRTHFAGLQAQFERDAEGFARSIEETRGAPGKMRGSLPDSACLAAAAGRFGDIGLLRPGAGGSGKTDTGAASALPQGLSFLSGDPAFAALTGGAAPIPRAGRAGLPTVGDTAGGSASLEFFDTENRAVQIALRRGPGGENLILFRKTPPSFLADAERIIEGRRTFARLHLSRTRLGRSFFYPFIFIYVAMVALSLGIAFFLAERLAAPIRRLERATTSVASGDWGVRLEEKTGGETGRLEAGFNRMVARLDQQQRRLVDMEKMASWREMARHLAHEIKNPLLPIRLAVQEMRDQYRGGDAGYSDFLADSARLVEDELSSLQSLVKEFSSFARMPGLSISRGSLGGLVSDVARLYAGAEIRIDSQAPPAESNFDQEAMRRVFVNLFDNSMAVMREGAKASIAISISSDDEAVTVRFADNGPGIPPENIPRIFDPYFTTRKEGTGLGLAVVKSVVLLHGGTIGVECPPAGGTAFTIRVPLACPAPSGQRENDYKEPDEKGNRAKE